MEERRDGERVRVGVRERERERESERERERGRDREASSPRAAELDHTSYEYLVVVVEEKHELHPALPLLRLLPPQHTCHPA